MLGKKLLLAVAAWACAAAVAPAQFRDPIYNPPGTVNPEAPPAPVVAPPTAPPPATPPARSGWWRSSGADPDGLFLPPHPDDSPDPLDGLADVPACRPFWVNNEFLFWATQGVGVPPLVTTSPPGVPQGTAGLLGQPTTRSLLGGERLLNQLHAGYRTEVGLWLDEGGQYAATARFYFLASISKGVSVFGTGTNVVVVPQKTTVGGVETQFPVYAGYPGSTIGNALSGVQTNYIGGDLNLRHGVRTTDSFRLDVLGGFRYLHLGDVLSTQFNVISAAVPLNLAPQQIGEDSVRTRNHFYGPQVGFGLTAREGRFTLDLQSTLAVGLTSSELDYARTRFIGVGTAVPAPATSAAALLAAATLAGVTLPGGGTTGVRATTVTQSSISPHATFFAVVPELGVKVGYHPTAHVRLTLGYTFTYWSRVRRAQELYDYSPLLKGGTQDFWAQGVSLGLEVRY